MLPLLRRREEIMPFVYLGIAALVGVLVLGCFVRPAAGPLQTSVDPAAAPAERQWRYIIIHHSASPTGGAVAFDRDHRAKGWSCLGYHFVIGNGTDTKDGQIEIGPRWTEQMDGAHTKTATQRFNRFGIGICLVGDFENGSARPTDTQMAALRQLVGDLSQRYHIPPANILGHREAVIQDGGSPSHTACPGKRMDLQAVRRMAM